MSRNTPTHNTPRQPAANAISLRPKNAPWEPAGPSDDEIRIRAFAIYKRRGDQPGTPEGDWEHARNELVAERSGRSEPIERGAHAVATQTATARFA